MRLSLRARPTAISIPQGSIKRVIKKEIDFTLNLFQFHKVRLKARRAVRAGTDLVEFQFHKVRLKANGQPVDAEAARVFQFHKVRLKAGVQYGRELIL